MVVIRAQHRSASQGSVDTVLDLVYSGWLRLYFSSFHFPFLYSLFLSSSSFFYVHFPSFFSSSTFSFTFCFSCILSFYVHPSFDIQSGCASQHARWSTFLVGMAYRRLSWSSDAQWFGAMRLSGDAQTVFNVGHGAERDIVLGMWTKRWWLWGDLVASDLNFFLPSTDPPYFCCYDVVRIRDTLVKLWQIYSIFMKSTNPSLWTMLLPFRIITIYFTILQTWHTGSSYGLRDKYDEQESFRLLFGNLEAFTLLP